MNMVPVAVLDEKNSAIIVEDIEDGELQQPANLDNVDFVDFGPEGKTDTGYSFYKSSGGFSKMLSKTLYIFNICQLQFICVCILNFRKKLKYGDNLII